MAKTLGLNIICVYFGVTCHYLRPIDQTNGKKKKTNDSRYIMVWTASVSDLNLIPLEHMEMSHEIDFKLP